MASSIHGTGTQKLARSMRDGYMAVSGIAFGLHFASRARPASLARPRDKQSSPALWTVFSRLLQRECALASGSSTQYPGRS